MFYYNTAINHFVRVNFSSQTNNFNNLLPTSFIPNHSKHFTIKSCFNSRWMIWRVVTTVKPFLNIWIDIFVKIFGLNFICERVDVGEELFCLISILGHNIFVTKVIRQGFTQVKNAHTKIDWFIKVKLCLLHVNGNDVFIESYSDHSLAWLLVFVLLYLMISIEYKQFLIFSSALPKTKLFITLKKIYFKVVSRLLCLYPQLRV